MFTMGDLALIANGLHVQKYVFLSYVLEKLELGVNLVFYHLLFLSTIHEHVHQEQSFFGVAANKIKDCAFKVGQCPKGSKW